MNVLYLEDDPRDADLARRELARRAPLITLDVVLTLSAARARLAEKPAYDLALIDLHLPDGSGLELLAEIRERALPLAVVILTGQGDEATAVAALKAGADDYLAKRDGLLTRLPSALEAALARFRAEAARKAGMLRVLYAEHNAADIDLTRRHLESHAPHIRLEIVYSAREALQRLPRVAGESCPCDVLLLDYRLPGENALEALKAVCEERGLDLPVVLVTGQGDEEVAAQALRLGAADYLVKHSNYLYELPAALENAHHRARLAREQAALRKSEDRYRDLVENSRDLICMHDLEGNLISVNEAAVRLTGYTREALLHMNLIELLAPKVRHRFDAYLTEIQTTGQARGIMHIQIASGETRYWEYNNTLRAEGVAAPIVRGMAHDITERKRAEDALRESEDRFRRLAENAQDIIYRIRLAPERRFEYVSPAATTITGFTPEEHYADPDLGFKLVHPDDRPLLEAAVRGEIALDQPLTLRWARKDGSIIWTEQRNVPIFDATGTLVAIEGIARDITPRIQAEERLRLQSAALNAAVNAMVITDREGTIEWANPAFTALTGYTAAEAIGKNPRALVKSGKQDRAFYRRFWETILAGQAWRGELINRRKDGGLYTEELTITPLKSASGEVTHFIAVKQDITQRKQAEETLRQHLAELETLHTVSAALRVAPTRDEALPILLDQTLATLKTDAGAIWLYHPASGELRAAVTRGWFRQLDETLVAPGEGIAGTVLSSGQTHLSAEFASDPLTHHATRPKIPVGWGGACLPLRAAAEPVGVLFVSVCLPRQITSEQVPLLESLTEMASAALHRMRLHEETVRRLDQLQALRSIDLAITASVDLSLTLNLLLEHVTTQLRVDAACIFVLNPHLQMLDYAAGQGFRTDALLHFHPRLGESFAGQAVWERRIINIPDLRGRKTDFLRSPYFSAEQFVAYYAVPLITKGEVKGVLEIFHRSSLHPGPDWMSFLEMLGGQAAIAIDNAQLFDGLQRANLELTLAYDATIEGWSRALDLRDKETEGHTQRVSEMTVRLAKALGISDAEVLHIRRGALLHDIGKMGVPDAILLKPGPLTGEEWEIMHQHPVYAYDMLLPIVYLRPALDIPLCHHEKWDGTGYPRGLKGEEIPPAARIFAVVDVWDALRSDRPYRKAWPKEKVLEHVRSLSGIHFDPRAVEAFLSLVDKG